MATRSSGYGSSVAIGANALASNANSIAIGFGVQAVADTTAIGGQKIVFPDAISLTVGGTKVTFACCDLCGAMLNASDETASRVHADWHRTLAPLLQLLGQPDTRRELMRLMQVDLEGLFE